MRHIWLVLLVAIISVKAAPAHAKDDSPATCRDDSVVSVLKAVADGPDPSKNLRERRDLICFSSDQLDILKASIVRSWAGLTLLLAEDESKISNKVLVGKTRILFDEQSTFQSDVTDIRINPLIMENLTVAIFEKACRKEQDKFENRLLLETVMREGGACDGIMWNKTGDIIEDSVKRKLSSLISDWSTSSDKPKSMACKFTALAGVDKREECEDKSVKAAKAFFTLSAGAFRFYLAHELGHIMVKKGGKMPVIDLSKDNGCKNAQLSELSADRFGTLLSVMEVSSVPAIFLRNQSLDSTAIDMYEVWTIFQRIPRHAKWRLLISIDASCPYPSPDSRSTFAKEYSRSAFERREGGLRALVNQFILDAPIVATLITPVQADIDSLKSVDRAEAAGIHIQSCEGRERAPAKILPAQYTEENANALLVLRFCAPQRGWKVPKMADELALAGAINAEATLRWYMPNIAQPVRCRSEIIGRSTWTELRRAGEPVNGDPAGFRKLPC